MAQTNKADAGSRSPLWRMVAARNPPPVQAVVAPARSADRVITAALSRAADRVHGLPLFFDSVVMGDCLLAELPEVLSERSVLSVVQGPGEGLGVVALSPGLLGALIEIQALGRISARPLPERRPTRTDGAICADFVAAVLAELATDPPPAREVPALAGWRYGSFVDHVRPLLLMLEDVAYRRVEIAVRAGPAGQRDGRIVIVLPLSVDGAVPLAHPTEVPVSRPVPRDTAGPMAAAVRNTPLMLQGVLCRRSITLGELRALAPGVLVPLPRGALDMAVLETASGQPVLRGRLGEIDGQHALRILRPQGGGAEPDSEPMLAAPSPLVDLSSDDPFRIQAAGEDFAPAFDSVAADAPSWDAPPVDPAAADTGEEIAVRPLSSAMLIG